jgi:hypothetical protein
MPALIVNNASRQCASMFTGDECMSCRPPKGWERVGTAYQGKCPQGYTMLKKAVSGVCQGHKTPFCCTVNHSGANGDCQDVVVNDAQRQCAFMEDITQCENLPNGWEKAEPQDFWGTVCPSLDYEWRKDTLTCGQ